MTRATARVTPPSGRTASTVRAGTAGPRTTPRTGFRTPPRPELRLVPGTTTAGRGAPRLLRHPRAPFVLLIVAMLVGTTLGLLVRNTAIAVGSLNATQLRTANAERAQEVQRLEQKVVDGNTPEKIARAADAAGMIPAGSAGFLVLDPDGGSVLRGTPEPAAVPDSPDTPATPQAPATSQAPAAPEAPATSRPGD
jgi:type II secretory pathway pseudopilin PulG